jgi:thiol-disulfide isomerase/thioredoxin
VLKAADSAAGATTTTTTTSSSSSSSSRTTTAATATTAAPEEEEEVVLLYFTRSGCEHCDAFTPKLKEALSKLKDGQKQQAQTPSVVVVSLDRSSEDLGATLAAGDPTNW